MKSTFSVISSFWGFTSITYYSTVLNLEIFSGYLLRMFERIILGKNESKLMNTSWVSMVTLCALIFVHKISNLLHFPVIGRSFFQWKNSYEWKFQLYWNKRKCNKMIWEMIVCPQKKSYCSFTIFVLSETKRSVVFSFKFLYFIYTCKCTSSWSFSDLFYVYFK